MAKFTKADDIAIPQSVGPKTAGGIYENSFQVYEPHQGRDLVYKNPEFNNGSTEVINEYDKRIPLGTYTLNNRDSWEENNFNESTFQPYLTEEYVYRKSYKLETWGSTRTNTRDGDIVLPSMPNGIGNYHESNTGKFSIEALPFVVNPNNQDIIHLDRYYDKEIDKENYELATEGKINLKLDVRVYGRVPPQNIPTWISSSYDDGAWVDHTLSATEYGSWGYLRNFGINIDIFSNRYGLGSYIDDSVEYKAENDGIYLFKLNWNDGTELEHTSEPKLLEDTVLFEHHYEKPGFYSITGVVYRVQSGQLKTWEKFKTNILLNPSPNYELNLFDYSNFASIGGISKDSAFVKSLYNMIGINPLTQDNIKASENVIEELNELDKILLLSILGKVDYEVIQPYGNLIGPYSRIIRSDSISGYAYDGTILGCPDPNATNYWVDLNGPVPDGYTLLDNGSCLYSHDIGDWDFNLTAIPHYGYITLNWNELTSDNDNVFTSTHPDGWEIDWATVQYRIQSQYYPEGYDLTDWLDMATVSHDTNTYNFNPDSPGYVEDREYHFRIQIQVPDPDTSNTMESDWFEMEEEGIRTLLGELIQMNVKVILSDGGTGISNPDNIGVTDPLTLLIDDVDTAWWNSDDDLITDILSGEGDTENPNSITLLAELTGSRMGTDGVVTEAHFSHWEHEHTVYDDAGNTIFPMLISDADNNETNLSLTDDFFDHITETMDHYIRARYTSYTVGEEEDEGPTYNNLNLTFVKRNYADNGTNDTWLNQKCSVREPQYTSNDKVTQVQFDDASKSFKGVGRLDSGGYDYTFYGFSIVGDGQANVDFGDGYFSSTNPDIFYNRNQTGSGKSATVDAYFNRSDAGSGDEPPTGGCFLVDTMITMANGSKLPIQNIQVGMEVMSYDENTNSIVNNKVLKTMIHKDGGGPTYLSYGEYLIINDKIKVTTNHAILADTNNRLSYDWPIADALQVGDYLFDKDLNKIEITSIERVEEVVDTYNFEVENSHTYIAENVIVHNAGGDGPGGSGKGGSGADTGGTG